MDVNPAMFSSSWTAPVARLRACHICKMFAAIDMSREGLWPWPWAWWRRTGVKEMEPPSQTGSSASSELRLREPSPPAFRPGSGAATGGRRPPRAPQRPLRRPPWGGAACAWADSISHHPTLPGDPGYTEGKLQRKKRSTELDRNASRDPPPTGDPDASPGLVLLCCPGGWCRAADPRKERILLRTCPRRVCSVPALKPVWAEGLGVLPLLRRGPLRPPQLRKKECRGQVERLMSRGAGVPSPGHLLGESGSRGPAMPPPLGTRGFSTQEAKWGPRHTRPLVQGVLCP